MKTWFPSFLDELTKISARDELTPEARSKQYMQFGALGAGMGPVIGGLGNFIQRGQVTPYKVPVKRWIPAQMATGALLGGVLPVFRDILSRSNVEGVKREHQAEKVLKAMAPEGPDLALKRLQRRANVLEL